MDCTLPSQGKTSKLALYIQELRAPFLSASILPLVLGGVMAGAWKSDLKVFILTLLCGGLIHLGSNTLNDYFDFKHGADSRDVSKTPFSGGSGLLAEGLLTPKEVFIISVILFLMATAAGLVLLFFCAGDKLVVVSLGIMGLFLGIAYTYPPFKLCYKGMGEAAIFLSFGPLPVVTAYYVVKGSFSMAPLLASLPVGLMTTAILWINQFPDYSTDKGSGKYNLLVRMGPEKGRYIYYLLIVLAASSIVLSVFFSMLPVTGLWALIFLIPSLAASLKLHKYYESVDMLIPAMGLTILSHALLSVILIATLLVYQ